MATTLTENQIVCLFAMIGVPYANTHFRVADRLGQLSKRFDTDTQAAVQTKTQILAWLNTDIPVDTETELISLITKYQAVEDNFVVLSAGSVGATSGVNYNPQDEKDYYITRVREIVPFYRSYQVMLMDNGNRRQLGFGIAS